MGERAMQQLRLLPWDEITEAEVRLERDRHPCNADLGASDAVPGYLREVEPDGETRRWLLCLGASGKESQEREQD